MNTGAKIMSTKRTEVETIDVTYEYYCDLCDTPTLVNRQYNAYICMICGRDICGKHRVCDPKDYSDHPGYYCVDCWEFGEDFRIEIERLENEAYDVRCKWEREAKEKYGKKEKRK